jgi:hypothetical protein
LIGTGDSIHIYLLADPSEGLSDSDHCLVVAEDGERQSLSKEAAQKFGMERFNLKKLKKVEVRGNGISLRSGTGLQLWRT